MVYNPIKSNGMSLRGQSAKLPTAESELPQETMDKLFEIPFPNDPAPAVARRPVIAFLRPCVRVLERDAFEAQACRFARRADSYSAIVTGDATDVLRTLPDNCIQTCVTSPPYWSLRDYCIAGQIGLESSVDSYIQRLVQVFNEVRRVLRPDGTLWLNIGDSYTSGGRTWRAPDRKNPVRGMDQRPPTPEGLKPKDLIGVPWRLAMALQDSGWYLRADIIWNKPNCQPESVKDRPTRSHEYVFLLSKSERYMYNADAVRGPNDRNLRTVWDIKTTAYKDAHFATYPPELVEPCVAIGSNEDDLVLDPFLGSGTTGMVALQMGRRFLGVELNPEYVKVAQRRLHGAILNDQRNGGTVRVSPDPVSPVIGGGAEDLAA